MLASVGCQLAQLFFCGLGAIGDGADLRDRSCAVLKIDFADLMAWINNSHRLRMHMWLSVNPRLKGTLDCPDEWRVHVNHDFLLGFYYRGDLGKFFAAGNTSGRGSQFTGRLLIGEFVGQRKGRQTAPPCAALGGKVRELDQC